MTTINEEHAHALKSTCRKRFASEVLAPLPGGQKGVYGLGLPLQLSATEVGILANIRSWGSDVVDLELGNDLLVIDRADAQSPKDVVPLNRTDTAWHASAGTNYLLSKYPMTGGFVPFGALGADGAPHPHAGSGFGLGSARGFPLDSAGEVSVLHLGELNKEQVYERLEFQQYRFEGKRFLVESSELLEPDELLDGWRITCPPLGNCVPDGADLLGGLMCRPSDQPSVRVENAGIEHGTPHLARWSRIDGRWTLVAVYPVADEPDIKFVEPSIVRDVDGDLLYSARDFRPHMPPLISVWRSSDNGRSWQQILRKREVIAQAPVTINLALDGTAYLASCPPKQEDYSISQRERLCLWPLSRDRTDTLDPVIARDCPAEFGMTACDMRRADHPVGMTVRLSDGAWHHLLCYRILEEHGAAPIESTGLYVEEVLSETSAQPPWKFSEEPD